MAKCVRIEKICGIADAILSQDPDNPDEKGSDIGKIEYIGLDIPLIQFT